MIKLKYSKYEDFKQDLILRDNIADLSPYEIKLPDPPRPEEFINFGLPIEQQFFKLDDIPTWVTKFNKEIFRNLEERERLGVIIGANREYTDFIADQWRKREEGIWIYIHGKPIYLTGLNWFFLNHYKHIQKLEFRYEDTEYFYWWKFCVEDRISVIGGMELSRRQNGKSARAGNMLLEHSTKKTNRYAGLQSKDEASIASFMSKCIVNPYNKLPFYFRPVNNSPKLAPKDKLEFRHPQDVNDSLFNTIEARSNTLKAFDGETLTRYLEDEAGKQDRLMVTEKWGVHRETLRVLGGKAIVTSTVEETTNGGMVEYKKLWELSDHKDVNMLGETESGLIRYFSPSYQSIRFDRYGFSIVDDPTEEQYQYLVEMQVQNPRMGGKEFIDTKIDSVKDSLDRAKLIRKYPRTIREAFRKSANNCEFDIIKLTNQQDKYLYKDSRVIGGNPDVILGNLSWKDNKPDTEVIFTECEHGRWKFNRAIFPYLAMNGNQTIQHGLHKYPKVRDLGCLGADAFKYGQTDEKRKSLGTITGYINYDMAIEDKYIEDGGGLDKLTDNIFIEYGWRQSSTDLYSEDCLMTSVFCGMPIFPEINVNCIVEHYMRRGYYGYLKFRKIWARLNGRMVAQTSNKPGMQTMGGEILNSLFNYVNDYICHDIHRCVFVDTINDFIQVEKGMQKDYDYFVSAAYALYGAKNKKGKEDLKKRNEEESFSDPLGLI